MHKRFFGIAAAAVMIVTACGGATTSSAPPASSGTAPSTAPSASGSAAAPAEETLTFVVDADLSGGLSNAADNVPAAKAAAYLYDGLYNVDAKLAPIPALAESLPEVSADGKTWTVKLRQGVKFHDGTDMTADDVVQTFQLAQSTNCTYSPALCLASFLDSVSKVDDYTVKFVTKDVLASFMLGYLAPTLIESKDAVDASYAQVRGGHERGHPGRGQGVP